jgi:ATP-dependent DNA helicase RecG
MAAATRMSRLLQGDVGAGKTLVALMALLIAVEAGGQGVMMAPTSILAGSITPTSSRWRRRRAS